MTLASFLSRFVGSTIRSRGEAYFREGQVQIEVIEPTFATATVRGSHEYDVSLKLEPKDLTADCTCPYAEDNDAICKHIWATVLALEGTTFARTVLEAKPVAFYHEYLGDEEDDDFDYVPQPKKTKPPAHPKAKPIPPTPPPPVWKQALDEIRNKVQPRRSESAKEVRPVFVIDGAESDRLGKLVLEVVAQARLQSGGWGKPKSRALSREELGSLRDPQDRQILGLLVGNESEDRYRYYGYSRDRNRYEVGGALMPVLLPLLAQSERVRLKNPRFRNDTLPLAFDPGPPWEFAMSLDPHPTEPGWALTGSFQREGEKRSLAAFGVVVPGMVIGKDSFAEFRSGEASEWLKLLKKRGAIAVPQRQADDFVQQLMALPGLPKLDLPKDMKYEEVRVVPRARLVVRSNNQWRDSLEGELSFDYAGEFVAANVVGRGVFNRDSKKFFLRDPGLEAEAAEELHRRGFFKAWSKNQPTLALRPSLLPKVVRHLIGLGWNVEAEGKLYRQPGEFKIEVSSGVDWFDLNASADFEGQAVSLPALLAALRRGENTILLDDGNFGMLPEEWLEKYGLLAKLGTVEGDSVRFRKAQVGLLDALIATRPEVSFDKQFAKAREQLRKFDGVKPAEPGRHFRGELREYQKEGLGWMQFLRKFGVGGCLADDMGLGKTVQVLAYLAGKKPGTTLIVVPKSLVFNWRREAEKFAPKLKVLDHTGTQRDRTAGNFPKFDIVLTTYGILRNDAGLFAEHRFDTCVLDESQAAKNADTETSKAVRLIRADHRLAMSGTPVENHLGELWTLFEFLNPGMLGNASLFGSAGLARNPPAETRELLAKALRPYILRRTKGQVAKDLPEKTEQTVYCDLEPAQRKLYDELRDHYRAVLLKKIDAIGLNKSKIQVLEALLRLRQAACHPGLIDKKRTAEDCAKLDILMPKLREAMEEGHKTLVFSQFTSLLAIVRKRLDKEKVVYEYLDGQTTDRQARVERFQNDPGCKVFLISLKAGGVGLNLTAAEYVFLLDPWWNPAAEAQAVDRTHRIGQTKPVFAYRLIARDTVEEKVLALQESKRGLAEAILGGEGSLVSELKREDLELLLS